jgi:hypothetical protein
MLAATIAAAAASPSQALGSWQRSGDSAELDAWIADHLNQADLAGISAAWVAAHPQESSADALSRAIMRGRRRGESLGVYLSRAVAAEHRAGRAEVVDGWYLAPTEARVAALAGLSK